MYIQRDTEYDYTIPRHEADCSGSLRVTAEHLYLAADWPMAMSLHAYIHVHHVTAPWISSTHERPTIADVPLLESLTPKL